MYLLKQYVSDFFSLLFPDLCNGCGRQLFQGESHLCTSCLYDLPYTDFHSYPDNTVAKLFWGRMHCHSATALLYFKKGNRAQHLIHRIKYRDQMDLAIQMGQLLGERLKISVPEIQADLIIPVPLHPRKERTRGYNQSQLIAEGIAAVLQLPVSSAELIRLQDTATQTRKTRYKRYENMRSVFDVRDPEVLRGRHIILVDDVITTGATLEACGQVLLESGISKLSIAALAYAK